MSRMTVLLLLHPCLLGQGEKPALPELEVGGLKPFKTTGIVLEKDGGGKVARLDPVNASSPATSAIIAGALTSNSARFMSSPPDSRCARGVADASSLMKRQRTQKLALP